MPPSCQPNPCHDGNLVIFPGNLRCIAEFRDNGSRLTLGRYYLRRMNLSGSTQGSGGLLSMTAHGGISPAAFYPAYDGNAE